MLALLDSTITTPVNIGSPVEHTINALAQLVLELTGSRSPVVHEPLPIDDPGLRRPDITEARTELGWEPAGRPAPTGSEETIAWFRGQLGMLHRRAGS